MLDMDDPPSRKALRMLFNAANKWAREDTAQVIFTCSDKMYGQVSGYTASCCLLFWRPSLISCSTRLQTLGKVIRREVLDNAKVYIVGHLHPKVSGMG